MQDDIELILAERRVAHIQNLKGSGIGMIVRLVKIWLLKWGEFLKDIISLANAYHSYVGQSRYLIFGFCESEKK